MQENERFKILSETKRFVEYVNKILVNYPKRSYVLKDRMENTSYELLELIYYTNMIEDRILNQKKILTKISMLDFYFEISYENTYISLKKLNQGVRILENIRRLVYGWIKNESKV